MCKELKLSNPDDAAEIITKCKNKVAVQAATDGVVIPDLGLA